MRVVIVVLGDFGQSPRMQYHALALADSGRDVEVIAYAGSAPFRAVSDHPRITMHLTRAPTAVARRRPGFVFVVRQLMRLCGQGLGLLWKLLLIAGKPDIVLVQNPPAVPSLAIALVAARLRSARLVIDWHNFSHAMLALRLGPDQRAVRMLRWHERAVGRRADAHLCVSRAMQSELRAHWQIPGAAVLYDRPAEMFAPTPPQERPILLRRILNGVAQWPGDGRPPAIIVCPTSWTADEDISILIEAAARCDEIARQRSAGGFGELLILVTGRGPLRDHYEREIRKLTLHRIHLRTLWLVAEDYARLLGSADIGVSCHRSASGIDLPMKIADLFGAGVPVCALDYGPVLAEQVRHGDNGLLFADAEQLAAQLYELFEGFPDHTPLLDRLRDQVRSQPRISWRDGWNTEAAQVFAA
ncbi:glycosyltransferase [Candidatus Binatus sp.]|jgi:beta-1,4-mannosyltransferase|uniref:glycosyltransferase n=1 Tax=Candidatus Binatus sp. TaxID=2811406 RepID=UPI003BDB0101